jgi:hypothetical protein
VPSDDKTEWYEEAGFFWSAVALGLALFLCCCFGGVMYCWNWSKANLGDDYRDKPADHDGGIFDSLPACPACPTSLSTCFGLLDKKDQVRSQVDGSGGGHANSQWHSPSSPLLAAIAWARRALSAEQSRAQWLGRGCVVGPEATRRCTGHAEPNRGLTRWHGATRAAQKGRAINYQTATYGSDAAEDADEERDVEHGEAGGFDNPWADEPPAAQDWAPKGHATSNPFADFQMHDNPLADGGQVRARTRT